MKKYLILINLIFIFPFFVNADLNNEQQESLASFAENLILKQQISPHVDNNGFPLIAYNMGAMDRISGYNENLIWFGKDEIKLNTINGMKWPFDCASWASYVYKHVLGVKTTMGDGERPYTVSHFLNNALSNTDFYVVRRNISVNSIDFDVLQKGDLIIIEGSHIMIYIGNGKISHVSTSAIVKGGSLGAEITNLKNKFPQNRVTIIRLKGTYATPNTVLTWPDTKIEEDLGPKDNNPNINIKYDNNGYIKKGIAKITLTDDKLVSYYSISTNINSYDWKKVNKNKYTINYDINSNGTYYISVKDSNNQIITQTLNVTNIDNDPPIIKNIIYEYNGNETYNVTVIVEDVTEVSYVLDNIPNDNYIFNNLLQGKHQLSIKDSVGNVLDYIIDLSSSAVPLFDISFDNKISKKISLSITPKDSSIISFYAIGNNTEKPLSWNQYNPTTNIDITQNGTYYIWLKSKNDISYYKKVIIDKIDNQSPIIHNYKIDNVSQNNFTVTIFATDTCNLEYSIVNTDYQNSNIFYNLEKRNYTFLVRDCAYNVSVLNINSNEFHDQYDNSTNILNIIFIILIIGIIIGISLNFLKIIKILKKK